jgi:hypothetical protein
VLQPMAEIVRWLLVLVLVISGAAKLLDRSGSVRSLPGFGVPDRAAVFLPVLLPAAEILLAAALLTKYALQPGAWLVLVLFAGFTSAVAINLFRGRRPTCHCFSQLSAGPIGPGTLVRNVILLLLAVLLVLSSQYDYWLFPCVP